MKDKSYPALPDVPLQRNEEEVGGLERNRSVESEQMRTPDSVSNCWVAAPRHRVDHPCLPRGQKKHMHCADCSARLRPMYNRWWYCGNHERSTPTTTRTSSTVSLSFALADCDEGGRLCRATDASYASHQLLLATAVAATSK